MNDPLPHRIEHQLRRPADPQLLEDVRAVRADGFTLIIISLPMSVGDTPLSSISMI